MWSIHLGSDDVLVVWSGGDLMGEILKNTFRRDEAGGMFQLFYQIPTDINRPTVWRWLRPGFQSPQIRPDVQQYLLSLDTPVRWGRPN